ncbi:MAG: iron-containing alcohol dehydrogenase PsrA [Casimicrobiaceae bacterium]
MVWTYANPVRVEFGPGALSRIAARIGGRRWALVTYDLPAFKAKAAEIAATAGKPIVTIDNIVANPDFADLVGSCRQYAEADPAPEVIVALGGGSIIDAAKVLAASDGSFDTVRDHLTTKTPLDARCITPIIAVPSTAGTGSEVTSWATVWDSANGQKYSLANAALYPKAAIVDPALALSAPRALTLATGLDALSHALESIWNVSANPVSATFAVEAAREVIAVLPALMQDLTSLDLRARQARAALFAGLAFSNTRTALAHNISYDITLKQGTPHGIACSFCLADVMQWSIGCDLVCDSNLRKIFGEDLRASVTLRSFIESLGVATQPSAYGLNDNEWRMLIERAMAGERGRNFIGRADLAA